MSEKSLYINSEVEESYWSLFWTFLKIGSTAFGGFMALISVVQNYLVDRKKLLSHEDMLDGISLATILPGPIAVNVVAYAGYRIRGLPGAFICAFAVILPSFFLLLGLSYAYFSWGEIPAVSSVFNGFLPAVAAIIVVAALNMGRKALVGNVEIAIAIFAMLALVFIGGFYITMAIIVASGILGYLLLPHDAAKKGNPVIDRQAIPTSLIAVVAGYIISVAAAFSSASSFLVAKLFATFSSMSLLLFGGGFVFIPLIQEVVVDSYQWVTNREFIDGIALGQVTPGPILISATFIGYKVAGYWGAALATIGIFTPPAILMIVCTGFLDRIRHSEIIKAILKGIRCGVIGMIAAAAYVVINSAEPNLVTLMIFVLSMSALLILKLEVVWIIPFAGILGYLMY
jgi:chromate transporter